MVVLDATTFMLFLRPDSGCPVDSKTKQPVERVKDRIDLLVKELDKAKAKIVVPTPALSEALVRAGAAASQQIIDNLNKSSIFRIEPFDTRAAIEVAAMTRAAIDGGDKRDGVQSPWQKVKYDRQIVAIAKVVQATAIYSDDDGVHTFADKVGIKAIRICDLPLPPESRQPDMLKGVPFIEKEPRHVLAA